MPRPFNYDAFKSVSPSLTAQCATAVLTALQAYPPEVQAAGLTVAFANFSDLYDVHEGTMLQVARNMLARARHESPALLASDLYMKGEL